MGSTYELELGRGAHLGRFCSGLFPRTAPLDYVYQMLVTDVLQIDWDHPGYPDFIPGEPEHNIDHTMIVTDQHGTPGAASEIYLSYHGNDRLNVPFWSWLLPNNDPEDVWYAHRK